jgi:proteic killer suppression protein
MIRSFRDSQTEMLFNDQSVLRFLAIERQARRKLLFLAQAVRLEDLICFRWSDGDAFDVEIVDYH